MKYVKFWAETPYCGTDAEDYQEFEDDVTEEELNEILYEMVADNAESFEYLATGWGEDFESEEERNSYYEDCTGGWRFITEREYRENQ